MQFKTEAMLSKGQKDGMDVVVDEIISSYNHKSKDHLEFDEMMRMVQDIMPEIDKEFKTDEQEMLDVVRRLDLDGDGTYDKLEVRNFVTVMLKHGW
jgi:Ca2+-binding EF-hand superfamily protein